MTALCKDFHPPASIKSLLPTGEDHRSINGVFCIPVRSCLQRISQTTRTLSGRSRLPQLILELKIDSEGAPLEFEEVLGETNTDALVILHRGNIVSEFYSNGMTRYTPHILMSVSKSILGIIVGFW